MPSGDPAPPPSLAAGLAALMAPKPKSRSGANIPEAQRKTVQRKLRISPEADAKLDQLAALADAPASRVVEAMIELEHDALKPKRGRK